MTPLEKMSKFPIKEFSALICYIYLETGVESAEILIFECFKHFTMTTIEFINIEQIKPFDTTGCQWVICLTKLNSHFHIFDQNHYQAIE